MVIAGGATCGASMVIDVTLTGVVLDSTRSTLSPTIGAVTPVARPLIVVAASSAYDVGAVAPLVNTEIEVPATYPRTVPPTVLTGAVVTVESWLLAPPSAAAMPAMPPTSPRPSVVATATRRTALVLVLYMVIPSLYPGEMLSNTTKPCGSKCEEPVRHRSVVAVSYTHL